VLTRPSKGDAYLYEAIDKLSKSKGVSYECYRRAAISIVQKSIVSSSIDDLISSAKGEPLVAEVGKLAIARCLLEAEKNSQLYVNKTNFKNKMNFEAINKTWIDVFFRLLFSSATFEETVDQLKKIKIISFNYDRCLKHYLYHFLINKYSSMQQESDIFKALTYLEILYPYGHLGILNLGNKSNSVDFGSEYFSDIIIKSAQNLQTYSEATDPSSVEISNIRKTIKSANTLFFLGLAFHKQNLDLLYGENPIVEANDKTVIASTFGISEFDRKKLKKKLKDLGGYEDIEIPNFTAYQTIKDYSQALIV